MRRSVWLDAMDPDPAKLKPLGIQDVYVDIRSATNDTLARIRSFGFEPGVFACSQGDGWPSSSKLNGAAWSLWLSNELKRFTPNTATNPRVHLNCETHDPKWIADMLVRYRQLRPTRVSGWTPEGHQAPLFAGISKVITAAGVDVLPQCYVGNMQRIESASEILAWTSLGIPAARVLPMYDGASLGAWALENGGCIFTQGRLP